MPSVETSESVDMLHGTPVSGSLAETRNDRITALSRKTAIQTEKTRDEYGRNVVVVETPAYDLTVFKVRYGTLTQKIYTSFIMRKWNPHVVALRAFRPRRARPISSGQMA
jgi:hypothetical protein